jgi:hypothetical protein
MRIVKVISADKTVRYGILKNNFLYPTFYSLTPRSKRTWSDEKSIFYYCLSRELAEVEERFSELTNPPNRIAKIIERKCKCQRK